MNRPFGAVLTHKQQINQVQLLFLTLHTWNKYPFSILQPFHLQLYHHQSTTPPPTGIFWYKQPSLSWLIKTIWTWIVRVAARTERESQQPAYLLGHQAFSIIEQCINRIKSILAFDDFHMNTSGLVYTVLFFYLIFCVTVVKQGWRVESIL